MIRSACVLAPFALALLACGPPRGGAGTGDVAETRPRLDGRIVLDVPIDEASADARAVWQTAERLRADRGPPPPRDVSLEEYTGWMRDTWGAWLGERVSVMQELRARFERLADGTPGERLFASVVAGHLYEDIARIIEELPLPAEVSADREMAASFAAELRRQAAPAYRRAGESWTVCEEAAREAPADLRAWGTVCAARLAELPEIAEPGGEGGATAVEIPPECRERAPAVHAPVIATGPHPYALLVSSNGVLAEAERDRVGEALHAAVRRRMQKARILSPRDVRAARTLASERRVAAGRSCARAPTVEDVLRRREPDVELLRASADCHAEIDEPTCTLLVALGESSDAEQIWSTVERIELDVRAWTRLASRLGDTDALVGVAADPGVELLPFGGPAIEAFEFHGAWSSDDDEETSPSGVVDGLDFRACASAFDAPPAPVAVLLEVAADGTVSRAHTDTGPAGAARIRCVADAARAARFAPATGARRVAFTVVFRPDDLVRHHYTAIVPDDAPPALHASEALDDWYLRDAIVRCHQSAAAAAGRMSSFRATLSIAPDGTVTEAPVTPATAPDGSDAIAACMAQALGTARFGCTPDDEERTLEVTLCVGAPARAQ